MAYTKYSLTPANNNAAPPDGAPEGMLPSAVNDTMRDMMAQIRDVGDGIRGGTYTMTAPVITGGSITGAALSGNTFTNPVITGGSINNTPIGASTANTGAFTTLGATGVATFSAGTVSAPAITTTGDTNTGIFFPAADTIAFTEGGVEAMRISSSANVGIGTGSPTARLCISGNQSFVERTDAYIGVDVATVGGNGGSLSVKAGAGSGSGNFAGNLLLGAGRGNASASTGYIGFGTAIGTNTVGLDAEYMRINSSGQVLIGTTTNTGSRKLNVVGSIASTFSDANDNQLIIGATSSTAFVSSSYGTTGAYRPLTFETNGTERMRIDTSGNVGIGTSSPGNKLEVYGTGTDTTIEVNGTGRYRSFEIHASGSRVGYLSDDSTDSIMRLLTNRGTLSFSTGEIERMRLNSSGNLTVGGTSNGGARIKSNITSAGNTVPNLVLSNEGAATLNSATALIFNNSSDFADGSFQFNSSRIQSICTNATTQTAALLFATYNGSECSERMRITSGGNLLVGTSDSGFTTGSGLKFVPATADPLLGLVGSSSSNGDVTYRLYSTGAAAYRFYVGFGGTVYATSTTITAISDARLKENIQDIDVGLDKIMALKPRKFDWKEGKGKDKKGDRGWIAQEFETVFPEMIDTWLDKAPEGEEPYKAVNADLIPVLVKAIQEQQTLIEQLTTRLNALEGK